MPTDLRKISFLLMTNSNLTSRVLVKAIVTWVSMKVTSRPSAPVDLKIFAGDVYLKFFTGKGFFSPGYNTKDIFCRSLELSGEAELLTGDPRW